MVDSSFVFLPLDAITNLVGRSRATVYRWISQGRFPPPVHLSPGSSGWRQSDYECWASDPANWKSSPDKPHTKPASAITKPATEAFTSHGE